LPRQRVLPSGKYQVLYPHFGMMENMDMPHEKNLPRKTSTAFAFYPAMQKSIRSIISVATPRLTCFADAKHKLIGGWSLIHVNPQLVWRGYKNKKRCCTQYQ
jgi:hypothetical protein